MKNIEKIALIYTRVSSIQQETDGTGNKSQESRCRELANRQNWPVEKTFSDTYTGAGDFMNRPAMRSLVEHIDENKHKNYVVIFDDLKRLSRETKEFINLRLAFRTRGVELKCLNFNFEDGPEGEFIETIVAASGQLERQQNRRQVIQKQRARMMDGYWPYRAFYGYKQIKVDGQGKVSIPNEKSEYIKEAIENFENGIFKTPTQVGRFLNENGAIVASTAKKQGETATSILRNCFYAGYIEYPKYEVTRRLGKHKALISLDTHNKVIDILDNKNKSERQYELYREDFELRGIVRCLHCNSKLRSYFTTKYQKNRVKKTPYYECKHKDCINKGKIFRAGDLHSKFNDILEKVGPKDEAIRIGVEAFEEAFKEFTENIKTDTKVIDLEMTDIESQIDNLISASANITSPIVQKTYSDKIEKLAIRLESLKQNKSKPIDMQGICRTSMDEMSEFIKSPYKIWRNCDPRQKTELYGFIFKNDFAIGQNYECRTPELSLIYQYFQGFSEELDNNLVKTPDLWRWRVLSPRVRVKCICVYNI